VVENEKNFKRSLEILADKIHFLEFFYSVSGDK